MKKLSISWSENPSVEENMYKSRGFSRTVGTVFMDPPTDEKLLETFSIKHRNTNLTVGAKALTKHYGRCPGHSYWKKPTGTETSISAIAEYHFKDILSGAVWKNIHKLSNNIIVYEIRNNDGYGMRWYLLPTFEFRGYIEADSPF